MKILHIINTLATGGAQSVLVQLLEGWGDGNDQQLVISLRNREPLSGRIEALNIPVEHIDLRPNKFEPWKFSRLAQIINKYKPDVVQTWLYHADLIGGLATRLAGRAPVVWGVHHTLADRHSVKSSTWVVARCLALLSGALPSRIICCSQSAHRSHVDFGYAKNKLVTVLNGVDTTRFRPDASARDLLRAELGLPAHSKLIGMFARFHPQKDHETFFQAAALLMKAMPEVHFVLAGGDIDASNRELGVKILRAGTAGNTHLLGNRQDMPKLNAGVDVVTLSSAYGEALPMTLCEAMSCGVPCAATNIGDAEILTGRAGLIVEPQDPQALAAAWQYILELNKPDYNELGRQARQRILEFYDLANMVKEYKSIYHSLTVS